ncbi:hypothetical protein [Roseateles oligotrophus]|uniref:4Fe-4S ferredoxin-type domain-containing protein n=1 Tax=Roseateles oligotrophus TaxID=1769250 RepID=A0ABT2Y8Y9_9BURK|nr:hypothetical protein [Roseateles oligotrophus]MCV2366758.1 hypothetical protein [Roseateles oligotrophus]
MPTKHDQVIQIHPAAPTKPAEGQPCNGCGVCCLSEPCPIGMLVSRRRQGSCCALLWSDPDRRYVCGMLIAPLQVLGWRGAATGRLSKLLTRISARWIAAGIGCDSSLQIQSGQATRAEPGADG